jgi:histidinol-phosphate aminotransferase
MLTRRLFTAGGALTAGRMWNEAAFAQRAAVGNSHLPEEMVWLNANENPLGPPRRAIQAMTGALPATGRYHFQEFRDFYAEVARSEGLEARQVLVGAGSSEVLHAAIDAFTSDAKPLIASVPTFEGPLEVMRGYGREVVHVPLTSAYGADVKQLVEAAEKSGGGVIYLCNPNNPTGTVTPKQDIEWLVTNLPKDTIALIDEAYVHYADTPEMESAIEHVRAGRSVVVTRTFSKIYGMAGLRAGFACARHDLISAMSPFRDAVISYVTMCGVLAALADAPNFLPQRRAAIIKARRELARWMAEQGLDCLDSHANFLMIDLKRDVRPVISAMAQKGVAVGRPFPPMYNFLRVSIGTEQDMKKFCEAFRSVYQA